MPILLSRLYCQHLTSLQWCSISTCLISLLWVRRGFRISFQQNYVQISGYNSIFGNWKGKHEGVGWLLYKWVNYLQHENDLSKGHNNLEILFFEIGGRKKKTSSFICVAYQPSSNEIEKLEWLENFENLLVDVYLKWKSVFIVTVNFNIDLLGDLKESILRYKNLLHTFSLHQHITKATWKNKTLIDHISSNINNKLSLIDVLMTNEMSGQDTPYRIFNIKKECCEPRYKDVKNDLKMNDYAAVADQHSIWVRWR